MNKCQNVEASLNVYDGRLTISVDLGEQTLTWMLENGDPEQIARQLWEYAEVRDWLVRLLAGESWTVISSSLGNQDYSARCQFLAAVKANVDEDRLRHAVHELAAAEAYVKEYWRVWHSLPNPRETYRGGDEKFSGESWEDARAWWRQRISEKLGLSDVPA